MTELRLEANFLALRDIGPWLELLLSGHESGQLGAIELGVHELAANCVDHARPSDGYLTLSGAVEGSQVTIQMRDSGIEFAADQVAVPDPERPQVRGYGLMIVEQLATELAYERLDDENFWRVTFPLNPPPPA